MKNKNEKYHTVRKVPNCNLKIIETEEKMIDAPSPNTYSRSLPSLLTGTPKVAGLI
jgi:hypothetical protein